MFGFSLVNTAKLIAIYEKLARLAIEKLNLKNYLIMKIKGTVTRTLGLQQGTSKAGKEWKKAEIVIETAENPQYPKKVKLSNMKHAEEFAKLQPGFTGVFHVEIESREFNDRWYTEVTCWKWEPIQQPQPQVYASTQPMPPTQPYPGANPYQYPPFAPQQTGTTAPNSDDLPF